MLIKNNKHPKLYVQLAGGLGNQMFQYATARALSIQHKLNLVQDDWNGFHRDFKYRRKYELDALNVEKRIANFAERLPLFIYRMYRRIGGESNKLKRKFVFGDFIEEEVEKKFSCELETIILDRSTWMIGYWQSPFYFSSCSRQISSELMPSSSNFEIYQKTYNLIINSESIALCIRLFEESDSPKNQCRNQIVKPLASLRAAINKMLRDRPRARIFLFCTVRPRFLGELALPSNTVFVTADLGFDRSVDTLWLLSNCDHHIITNSTYYWWGAWLSQHRTGQKVGSVMAADNFVNLNCLPEEWGVF
jgi:hypothetical protein